MMERLRNGELILLAVALVLGWLVGGILAIWLF